MYDRAKKVTLREPPAEMNLGADFIVTAATPSSCKYAMLCGGEKVLPYTD